MDFEGMDPDVVLEKARYDFELFQQAVGKMQRVDNYDERLPSGLTRFSKFFNSHHREMYSKDHTQEALHKLFQGWCEEHRDEGAR